ncbi:MAG: hypothetical protein IPN17_17525 [Deltaproteobacteria bacterium]|nr:hypothetical protein [Deltaproteobacteria bacterium]
MRHCAWQMPSRVQNDPAGQSLAKRQLRGASTGTHAEAVPGSPWRQRVPAGQSVLLVHTARQ